MAPKKLSESEKKEIVQLYMNPDESTSTLASRFGVSSSTISRVLKQELSDDDYNNLVQQKRTGSQPISSQATFQEPAVEEGQKDRLPPQVQLDMDVDMDTHFEVETRIDSSINTPFDGVDSSREPLRRRRRRSRTNQSLNPDDDDVIQLPLTQLTDAPSIDAPSIDDEPGLSADEQEMGDRPYVNDTIETSIPGYPQDRDENGAFDEEDSDFVEALDDDLLDEEDDFSADLDDDLDEEEDEDYGDGDDLSDEGTLEPLHFKGEDLVQIYPFADAELPRTCYLVIDRSAELITRPLQEFGELGDLPSAELSENTLPVFDNHRVAKRFANRRTQRIVKIPDSRILRKTTPYLQSKGITRLLIDGQVYSLTE